MKRHACVRYFLRTNVSHCDSCRPFDISRCLSPHRHDVSAIRCSALRALSTMQRVTAAEACLGSRDIRRNSSGGADAAFKAALARLASSQSIRNAMRDAVIALVCASARPWCVFSFAQCSSPLPCCRYDGVARRFSCRVGLPVVRVDSRAATAGRICPGREAAGTDGPARPFVPLTSQICGILLPRSSGPSPGFRDVDYFVWQQVN